jgi:serine/threonine protein kinase
MTSDPLTELSTDDRARLEAVLVEFDLRWTPDAFTAAVEQLPIDGPFRDAALREMIKIDLERHARRGAPVSLRHYLEQFPELAETGNAPADLVAAEAAARDTLPLPSPPGSVHLPKVFGRYRIVRPLGRGGMGGVYLARDRDLDREVALKVPRFPPDDAGAEERFAREAKAAATIDHPNVCRVYDVGRIDGLPYITMAYIEGPSLADVLSDGPMPPRRAAEIARDVARALAEAHRRGIVHRDLKPANILMSAVRGQESGVRSQGSGDTQSESLTPDTCPLTPVVTDFGLAARTVPDDTRLTVEGTIAGTPPYMSPEQIAGERAGPASDVYSLGAMLYEMATGRTPFTGTRVEIFTQVLGDKPDPPSAIRPENDSRLDSIVLKALAKKPADRFPDMAAFADALDKWLAGSGERKQFAPKTVVAAGVGLILLALIFGLFRTCESGPNGSSPRTPPGATTVTAVTTGTAAGGPDVSQPATTSAPALTTTRRGIFGPGGIIRPPKIPEPVGLPPNPLPAPDERILAVTFAAADREVYTATKSGARVRIRRWDVASAKELDPTNRSQDRADWVSFSANGKLNLIGGAASHAELKRSETGESVWKFDTGSATVTGAISRDGRRVVVALREPTADRRARAIDASSGDAVGNEYAGHKKNLAAVALSDDGQWAFSASPDQHAVWELKTGTAKLQAGENTIRCAVFLPGSGRLVVGSTTGIVSVYNLAGAFQADTVQSPLRAAVNCLIVSPDGQRVAAGSADRVLHAWDPSTRYLKWRVADLAEPVIAAAFSSDGTRLVTADEHSWRIWELPK